MWKQTCDMLHNMVGRANTQDVADNCDTIAVHLELGVLSEQATQLRESVATHLFECLI